MRFEDFRFRTTTDRSIPLNFMHSLLQIGAYTGDCEQMWSKTYMYIKGEVSPNNNVDWVSRKQFYKPNSKIVSKFW